MRYVILFLGYPFEVSPRGVLLVWTTKKQEIISLLRSSFFNLRILHRIHDNLVLVTVVHHPIARRSTVSTGWVIGPHAHLVIKVQCCSKAFIHSQCWQNELKFSNNLRRHEKHCPLKDQERGMSEAESQTMYSEDDASAT